ASRPTLLDPESRALLPREPLPPLRDISFRKTQEQRAGIVEADVNACLFKKRYGKSRKHLARSDAKPEKCVVAIGFGLRAQHSGGGRRSFAAASATLDDADAVVKSEFAGNA